MTISVSGQYVQVVVWEHVREESWEGELIRERCDEFILHPYAIKMPNAYLEISNGLSFWWHLREKAAPYGEDEHPLPSH